MPPILRLVSVAAVVLFGLGSASAAEPPHWIWGPKKYEAYRLTRRVVLNDAVTRAAIRVAADFCRARVLINGELALSVEPYCQTQDLDVTQFMRRGENEIAVVADGPDFLYTEHGPPAVALSLHAAFKDGRVTEIVTDAAWQIADDAKTPATDLGAVRPEVWGIGRRPATVSPFENYEQWKQTLDKTKAPQTKFDTAPGFTVTTLRNAGPDEGSWIAMAFDAEGRLTISREDQGLLRLTLADDRRSVTDVEPIDVELKECRGLAYDGEWLYANANNSKAMYRLKIDDEGTAHDLQTIREFPGDAGHGRNDLTFGPNGELYSIHGDAVLPPGEPIFDHTSPLRESRRGPPRKEGYLLRTDRDGKFWELVCTGLRNPYGVAVHPNGDVFTYDADNEFDMGTPWYRPTRVVQLASGADYGYRANGKQWPVNVPDHPDNGLPVIDVGRGSPTAAMFGTQLKSPPEYRDALYVLDWSYGRVLAVHLAERGAGYRAALEVFLQGRPLNVTDIAAGPDGAMYLTTGGRKTQSALYRVEYTGKIEPPPVQSQHEQDAAAFSKEQRATRFSVEGWHGSIDPCAGVAAEWHLGSLDPTVRHSARIVLEQLPAERSWPLALVSNEYSRERQLVGLIALSRIGDPRMAAVVFDRVLGMPPDELWLAERYEALFLLRQSFDQIPDFVLKRRSEVVQLLQELLPDDASTAKYVSRYGDAAELRRRIAVLLGDLQVPEAVEFAAPLLDDPLQENKLQGLLALRHQREGWTPELRRKYFETLNAGSRFVGGQGMPQFLDKLRSEAIASLSEPEEDALADVLKPAPPVDEPLPPLRKKVREWTLDALHEAYADGSGGDAKRGEVLFRDALCSRCHRSGLAGPAVGPDLTYVARRFSRHDILESIVKPSLAVAEQYRNAQVATTDGQVYTGRVVSEGDFRSEKLILNVDPLHPSKTVTIDKKEIDEYRITETSPMPQGLLDTFTLAEIRDLLAFLEAGAPR